MANEEEAMAVHKVLVRNNHFIRLIHFVAIYSPAFKRYE